MREPLASYTQANFPYSGILAELTEQARKQGLSPAEAYAVFLDKRAHANLSPYFDYASTSITTGGHAHYMPNIANVIEANTRTAREIIALLDRQRTLVGHRVVLPVDLGKTGWSQAEYITYWGLTIAGPDLRLLRRRKTGIKSFEDKLKANLDSFGVDLTTMNSNDVDREVRRVQYALFVKALAEAIRAIDVRRIPAYRVISLVDTSISLGCWAEKQLADMLRIPTQRVAPVKLASVDDAVPFSPLLKDIKVIVANGGVICVAPEGSILTLVGDDTNA